MPFGKDKIRITSYIIIYTTIKPSTEIIFNEGYSNAQLNSTYAPMHNEELDLASLVLEPYDETMFLHRSCDRMLCTTAHVYMKKRLAQPIEAHTRLVRSKG